MDDGGVVPSPYADGSYWEVEIVGRVRARRWGPREGRDSPWRIDSASESVDAMAVHCPAWWEETWRWLQCIEARTAFSTWPGNVRT